MLIPYSTDAPLYHYPIGTVTLIVLNIVFFIAFCADGSHLISPEQEAEAWAEEAWREEELMDEDVGDEALADEALPEEALAEAGWGEDALLENTSLGRKLVLDFGDGLKPWQWLTNAFMHADIWHLLGNLIFLWCFGLIVEGKVGLLPFLAIYCGITIVQSAVLQVLMLGSDPVPALGASSVIYGLLAIVFIWAPRNEFDTLVIFLRVWVLEIPVLVFCLFYIGINAFFFYMGGFQMSSEALHLSGAAVGAPIGFFMLTRGYVDCEGFDIISVWRNEEGKYSTLNEEVEKKRQVRKKLAASRKKVPVEKPADAAQLARLHDQVTEAITEGNLIAAQQLQASLSAKYPQLQWREPDLRAMVLGAAKLNDPIFTGMLCDEYLARFGPQPIVQLIAVRELVQQGMYDQAAQSLATIDRSRLTASHAKNYDKLAAWVRAGQSGVESGR